MLRPFWIFVFTILLLYLLNNKCDENFVSGKEELISRYDQIYPLDDPKYTTPQQKDFQIVLSEHSALDPNMQLRRPDIATNKCKIGEKCFNIKEYHEINYPHTSAPDIINSKIGFAEQRLPDSIYLEHHDDKVVPANSTSTEMRADLFTDIVLPELYFKTRQRKYGEIEDKKLTMFD